MDNLITNSYDKKLLEEGLNAFSLYEKNELIMYLANKHQKLATEITEEFILDYYKNLKIRDFSIKCEDTILNGFTASNGHTYATNRDGQFNMFAKYVMIKDNADVTTVMYKAEDVGEQVPHTKEEFISVVMEGFKHVEGTLTKLDELRKQIRQCATNEEILAIKW